MSEAGQELYYNRPTEDSLFGSRSAGSDPSRRSPKLLKGVTGSRNKDGKIIKSTGHIMTYSCDRNICYSRSYQNSYKDGDEECNHGEWTPL